MKVKYPNNNDFVTVQIGRQPLIISRDSNGELHAMVNACEHSGAAPDTCK